MTGPFVLATWLPRATLRAIVFGLLFVVFGARAGSTEPAREPAGTPSLDLAVLLPLTGPWETLGQRALRQVRLAADETPDVTYAFFDTGPGVEGALQEALAAEPRAILGPLGELETREAVGFRAETQVPLFSLAGTEGIEDPDQGVYRLRTSAGEMAGALATWLPTLADEGERPSAAVLAPDDGYGREAAAAFVQAAVRAGMTVHSVVFYEPDTRELRPHVEELTGRRMRRLTAPGDAWQRSARTRVRTTNRSLARPTWIFLPDESRRVADLAPFLAFEEWFTGLASSTSRGAGLSAWEGSELAFAGDLLGGSHVAMVFHVDDLATGAQAWVDQIRMRYGQEPSEFDAQTYDAALWAFEWARRVPEGARMPEGWQTAMALGRVGGACGDLWMGEGGAIRRAVRIFEVSPRGEFYWVETMEPAARGAR